MKHLPTFSQYLDKYGDIGLYDVPTVSVDGITRDALKAFFSDIVIGDTPIRFQSTFRRAIMLYYPVYRDQIAVWAERTAKSWLYDNIRNYKLTHEGTATLDAKTIDAISSDATMIGKAIAKGQIDVSATSSSTSDTSESGKDRTFSFTYPESNYQGGVIPYDLDNDPAVEFIDTQADNVSMKNTHVETETEDESQTRDERQNDTTDTETRKTDQTNTVDQDTTNKWVETKEYDGDTLNKLTAELIEQIPMTNYFHQFTCKMFGCFEFIRISDDDEPLYGKDKYLY